VVAVFDGVLQFGGSRKIGEATEIIRRTFLNFTSLGMPVQAWPRSFFAVDGLEWQIAKKLNAKREREHE